MEPTKADLNRIESLKRAAEFEKRNFPEVADIIRYHDTKPAALYRVTDVKTFSYTIEYLNRFDNLVYHNRRQIREDWELINLPNLNKHKNIKKIILMKDAPTEYED